MDRHPGLAPDTVTVLWCTTDGDERRKAHTLLVRAAAGMLDVPLSEIWLEHEEGGRPLLCGAGKPVQVSVTHGRGSLAVALTGGPSVGVDVEVVRPLRAEAMARAWLDPVETAWVTGLAEEERSTAFLWLWTQKESVGKALGRGLRRGGMSRRVPLPEAWPPGGGLPPVLRPLPADREVASAAVLVDGGRRVIGVAQCVGTGSEGRSAATRVRVQRVSPAVCS
ncbi:4'-phosphopantetheinyl transferase superfamily protein [Streptomyces sp. WZ.A104]|uniref:4'-phosphopantetheinyl transferase family protein n=1 Tax=Streptomyces sp. WZ.A104 TaxID=2023771 RepID=UPI00117D3221|nr:4'-phosphopantetheinyl transferase superfamily protein [Streptomyces sp. WZ.A104]